MLRLEAIDGQALQNPFVIRKSVENCAGNKIAGAFSEHKGSFYALKVRNENHVKKLLKMEKLIDGTCVKVSIHPTLNTVRCVVYCAEVSDLSEDELKDYLKDQKVTEVRRITRKIGNQRTNTPSMILTIGKTVAPEYIEFGYIRARTRPFYTV